MKFGIVVVALGCALLSGCGDPPPRGSNMSAAELGPDPIEAKIANLSEPAKITTFYRAINDADYDCQNVVNIVSRGKVDGKPVWAVECNRGAQYVVELQRGGIFHVSGVPKAVRQ